jgi:putative oxidoreductase
MLRYLGNAHPTIGLLPLRIVLATVFLMHGGQKLFVNGLAGTTGAMDAMGIPLPQVSAFLVTVVELAGGLAILLGYKIPWAALLLAADMAVAILAVRLKGGFFAPAGAEFELTLLGGLLTLALLGTGRSPSPGGTS